MGSEAEEEPVISDSGFDLVVVVVVDDDVEVDAGDVEAGDVDDVEDGPASDFPFEAKRALLVLNAAT